MRWTASATINIPSYWFPGCPIPSQRSAVDGRPFITSMFNYAGGVGARAHKPGLSATAYPTGVAAVPVEVVESTAPLRFVRKELRHGSGGVGAQPGGMGQVIEFTVENANGSSQL